MKGNRIRRALASCRRVFLLLLPGILLLATWLYWQAPRLDELRPLVITHLEQQLQLEDVQLGELSWHWVGFLWLEADRLSFRSQDKALAYDGGHVAVRIPLTAVMTGNITPSRIRLSGGRLDIHITDTGLPVPAEQLILDDVAVDWRFRQWQGVLPGLQLKLDSGRQSLQATSPSLQLSARLDADGLPADLELHCSNTEWLPEPLLRYISGRPSIDIRLRRLQKRQWQLTAEMRSESTTAIRLDESFTLAMNRLHTEIEFTSGEREGLEPERIDIRQLNWSLRNSSIAATGNWQHGKLELSARSGHLDLPVMWSWLRPLDDDPAWHQWLSLMQTGTASHAVAELSLDWPAPWREVPDSKALHAMKFAVQGDVKDADIALGVGNDFMLHTRAHVELDEESLHATVHGAELPRSLGSTSGELLIPWSTLDLHISGHARANMGPLMQWFGPEEIGDWQWHEAEADGRYRFLWDPAREEPDEAEVELRPTGIWNVTISEIPLQLSDGNISWDQDAGLTLEELHVDGAHMQGVLSLSAARDSAGQWAISGLEGRGTGDFAQISAHFQLPVSHADGSLTATLRYRDHWSGSVDMQNASWDHLLGSSKETGDPFVISYRGSLDTERLPPTINLSRLEAKGKALQLHQGRASINRHGLRMSLENLHTPAFIGSLDIHIPFGNKPWEIEANADYLNRNALPETLNYPEQLIDKPWVLRARLSRFDWNDARMSGVLIQLSSIPGNVGMFEAKRMHTAQLAMQEISATFALPGRGEVDLRHFAADIERQHLVMSARLRPAQDGGMRWHGFAELEGDFGHLMKQGGLSQRFLGGRGHVLFSGEGVMLREQPWWEGLNGRLRLRVDDGRILEGGTLTTFLAATSLTDLPKLLAGQRKDLTGPGIMFERLQMEAIMQNQHIDIRNVVMRSSAFDVVGYGGMDIAENMVDLYLIVRPLQNLDALLSKIPLLRDILGGQAHSLMRKIYHMHGPFTDARVEALRPEEAGQKKAGIIEHLFSLPGILFGREKEPATP